MKIAIVGANGRLGAALVREYQRDYEVTSYDRRQLDLGQLDRVRSALAGAKFELLINCAALTNVDYCESHREEAFVVNAEAPRLLAEIANEKSAKLVHFSTDYVFDGKKTDPYVEEDKAVPLSVYGESKLEGERRVLEVSSQHLVVRLSWVFGPDKPSFIDQIIQRARGKRCGHGGSRQIFCAYLHHRCCELVASGHRQKRERHFASGQQWRMQLAGMGPICDRCLP